MHCRYYNTDLAPEFWLLVECLEDMSKRWEGSVGGVNAGSDLAAKYASRLRALHGKCSEDPHFTLDALGYATDGFPDQQVRHQQGESHCNIEPRGDGIPVASPLDAASVSNHQQALGATPEDPRRPVSGVQLSSMLQPSPTNRHFEHHSQDELAAISTALMDQDFTQLDRVISFDDMSFTVQVGNPDGPPMTGETWNFGQ